MVTGGSGGLLRGTGTPYLAVGRRGGLRVQLPAASKEERRRGVKTSRPSTRPHPQAPWANGVGTLWLPKVWGTGGRS